LLDKGDELSIFQKCRSSIMWADVQP